MNAITLIWRQVLKELKLFQMKENKEDAVEKTDKEPQKTLKCHEDKYTVPLPDTAPPTEREKETERKQPVRLTQEVRTFLQKQYDFRYNLLTEETEYRPANKRARSTTTAAAPKAAFLHRFGAFISCFSFWTAVQ